MPAALRLSLFACLSLSLATAVSVAAPIEFAEREVLESQGQFIVLNLDGSPLPELIGSRDGDVILRRNLSGRGFGDPIRLGMSGSSISRPVAGDLNGDGRTDLAVMDRSSLLIRMSLGGLSYGPVVGYGISGAPWEAWMAPVSDDLDGDSYDDLILVWRDSLVVYRGSASGAVTALASHPLTPWGRYGAQLADVNGDGHVDLLMVAATDEGLQYEWYPGAGDGTFGDARAIAPGTFFYLPWFTVTDLDHDGDMDIATPATTSVLCLLNDGGGLFTPTPSIGLEGTSSNEYTISSGDLDMNGTVDIVLAGRAWSDGPNQNHFAVIVYDAMDSTRRRIERIHVPQYPTRPQVADLDGDGYPDVAVEAGGNMDGGDGFSTPSLAILWSNGRGRLAGKLEIPLESPRDARVRGLISARATADASPDLVTSADGQLLLLKGRGDGAFSRPQPIGYGTPQAAGDCDADGADEVFATSSDSLWMSRRASPASPFGEPTLTEVGSAFLGLADVDGDHRLDLIFEGAGRELRARSGNGMAGFGPNHSLGLTLPALHGQVLLEDLDRDGWADIATGTLPEGGDLRDTYAALHVAFNDHAGGWRQPAPDTVRVDLNEWGSMTDISSGDVDGDGDRDIVIVRRSSGSTAWFGVFLNAGDVFHAAGPGRTIGFPGGALACEDLDGDGLADILTHDNDGLDLDFRIFQAIGGGQFADAQARIGVHYGSALVVRDFDADGRPDVAMLSDDGAVDILLNSTPYGPTPVQIAAIEARVVERAIEIEWAASGGAITGADVERAVGGTWRRVAGIAADGLGHLRYRDTDIARGARYGYRLRYREDGRDLRTAESWVTVPELALALRATSPVRGVASFHVALPAAGAARLDVLDVTGRRVRGRVLEDLDAGEHAVSLDGPPLPAGLYFARLRSGTAGATARFVVVP